jgi:hypothetical protein
MSWWDTGHGTDVIGDRPADLADAALKEIARAREQQSLPKPKLDALLRAIGLALSDPPSPLREVVAEGGDGSPDVSSGPLQLDDSVRDIVPPLQQTMSAIAREYQERWERKPRLSELLSTFSFVLGYRPEDFLQDGGEHPVKEIRAVASK